MADSKISGLTSASAATTQEVPVNAGTSTTRRVTLASVLGLIASPGISQALIAQGTITDPALNLSGTVTWNDAADTFTAWKLDVTNTASASASKLLDLQVGGNSIFSWRRDNKFVIHGAADITLENSAANLICRVQDGQALYVFGSSSAQCAFPASGVGEVWLGAGINSGIRHIAEGVVRVTRGTNGSDAGSLEFIEQTAPSAGSANTARIYAEDNGAGKTKVMAKFSDGSTAQICIQP